eukprot:Protomagalhaensia_wolfi_Nauph_80__4011@NODE_406_length_2586_cov_54_578720_g32_i1_p3_GENE_NODE_406_length_2586_cov_54_578720_g32_i1NODE_406_length_2586_cov_54_578720_g32_i1_p3_ORF_typecomplete_len176_score2_51APG5/PF04106_12/0_00092_NODE_406_length_2586_cov_54_578720_g32_i119892516
MKSSQSLHSLRSDSDRKSVLNGVTNWSLGVAYRWMSSLRSGSGITNEIPLRQEPCTSDKEIALKVKRKSFQSTRLPVRLNVWGPPLIYRLMSFPVKHGDNLITMAHVIRASFPPNLAEWILTQLDYGDRKRCSVTVEGIVCDLESPLVWWYLNCIGWQALLQVNIQLPPRFVSMV